MLELCTWIFPWGGSRNGTDFMKHSIKGGSIKDGVQFLAKFQEAKKMENESVKDFVQRFDQLLKHAPKIFKHIDETILALYAMIFMGISPMPQRTRNP